MKNIWKLSSTVKWRLTDQLFGSIAANMILPFMIIYLAEKFGASLAGLLTSLNILLGMIIGFYGGYLADRYGRRRVMLFAESGRLLAFLIMCVANSPWMDSPVLTFAAMMGSTLMSGLLRPAGQAMLVDASSPEDRRLIYSVDYWVNNVSILLGSVVGGFWFGTHRFGLLLALAVSSMISLLILVVFIRETNFHREKGPDVHRPRVWNDLLDNYKTVLQNRVFRPFLLATLLDMAIEFSMRNYLGVRLGSMFGTQTLISWGDRSFTADGVAMFGLLMMLNTVTVVLLMGLVTKMTKRVKDRTLLVVGLSLYSVGYGVLVMVNQAWVLIGLMLLGTIGELIYAPVRQALLADIIPSDRRSSYMAVNYVTFRGSMMIGSLTVSLAAVLPSWGTGVLLMMFGATALLMFRVIFSKQGEEVWRPFF